MNIFVKINIWQWIDDPFVSQASGQRKKLTVAHLPGMNSRIKIQMRQKSMFEKHKKTSKISLGYK